MRLIIIFLVISIYGVAEANMQLNQLRNCLQAEGVDLRNLVQRNESSAEYIKLNYQWNPCCGHRTPLAYLVVRRVSDIQHAIVCSKKVKVKIVPRGGGHSYGKYSFGDSNTLVIDLRKMDKITVDTKAKTSSTGPGALLGQIVWKISNNANLYLPSGVCMTVGIAFALGGGFGKFSRLHGMTSDNLLEMDLVDAFGNLLTVNNESNSDLFWALRGGSAGSFGIVTRYKFRLFDKPHTIVEGISSYPLDDFPQLFQAWQLFVKSDQPNTITADMNIQAVSPPVILLYVTERQTEERAATVGQNRVRDILSKLFPATSVPFDIQSYSYLDFQVKHASQYTNITKPSELQYSDRPEYRLPQGFGVNPVKSTFVPRMVGEIGALKLLSLFREKPRLVSVEFRALGGAINNVGPTDTAYFHRSQNLFRLEALFAGKDESEGLPWMRLFFKATKPILKHKESYQNHLDFELVDYLSRYYGSNAPRLIKIKKKYDPENVFFNAQSIPTNIIYGR